jgi:hypothetical protein
MNKQDPESYAFPFGFPTIEKEPKCLFVPLGIPQILLLQVTNKSARTFAWLVSE